MCCKLPRISEPYFRKAPNTYCSFCAVGKGCKIYDMQPKVCRQFRCRWLDDEEMSDGVRPDRVGFYVTTEGTILKINVDPDRSDVSRAEIDRLRHKFHVIMQTRHKVEFLPCHSGSMPEKLILEWTL